MPSPTNAVRAAALSLTLATIAGAQAVVGRADAVFSTRQELRAGQRLLIASPNGAITVQRSDSRSAEISVEKRFDRRGQNEDIGIKMVRTDEGLAVCAVFDDEDRCSLERGYERARSRDYDRMNGRRAVFTVRVPADVDMRVLSGNGELLITGVGANVEANTGNGRVMIAGTVGRVRANTGNGDVVIEDAHGDVQANTGNGVVRVATSDGPVTATTGNGDVHVSMARLTTSAPMTFRTGSGDITLTVPQDFGAEMDGSTGNGRITSEIPVTVRGGMRPEHVRGTLGAGGSRLSLSTGNGDITIRRTI
jgi:DUF4097 and DUF4098 domain-containing protein YvlB